VDSNSVKIYTEHDDGISIFLALKDTFEVRLSENPTTGFRWHLLEWDHSILELSRDEFFPPNPSQQGSAGRHAWEFKVQKIGQVDLELAYRRKWGAAKAMKRFALHVSVV
jgi:predicted secreted protein